MSETEYVIVQLYYGDLLVWEQPFIPTMMHKFMVSELTKKIIRNIYTECTRIFKTYHSDDLKSIYFMFEGKKYKSPDDYLCYSVYRKICRSIFTPDGELKPVNERINPKLFYDRGDQNE